MPENKEIISNDDVREVDFMNLEAVVASLEVSEVITSMQIQLLREYIDKNSSVSPQSPKD